MLLKTAHARFFNPPREFGSASWTDDWPLSARQAIKVGLFDKPITFMTVGRRPIAGQITAAEVRRTDGLVLFVGTKRTELDQVIHSLIN